MELSEIQGHALSSPIQPVQERSFHGGVRRLLKRDVVLVVVETKDGRRGFSTAGASSSAMREYFEDESQGTFADVLNEKVSPELEGSSIESPADIRDAVTDTNLPSNLHSEAVSALDIAYHDLLGKELGTPVYELLAEDYGSTPTPEMPLYASAGMYMKPEGYAEQAKVLDDNRFFGYKYRPGIGPDADRRTVELLFEALDEMEVMLDVHTWWKLGDAYGWDTIRDLVEHATQQGAYWIEEPVEPDDYDGYIELAKTGAPLAGGESEQTPAGLLELGQTGAVDYLQGDVRHHEGFTGCQDAVEFCAGTDTEFVPHNFGTWFGLVANAHLVAAAPDVSLLEYPVFEDDPLLEGTSDPGMYPFELAFDIIEGEPEFDDGRLTLSDEPGLGVEVNLDVIEEYPFIEGPWTEFHYEDD
jgi:L-alanine-DL-glutamate epimerase-like enolase superfamily enzyme